MLESKKRIEFIDVARSIAILLMLEGHYISKVLDPAAKELNPLVYSWWQFSRTHTAALFFVVSGIVFTYLLMKESELQFWKNPRVKKGALRSFKLFIIGILLHIDLRYAIHGQVSTYVFTIHVLQCISLMLFSIIIVYILLKLFRRESGIFIFSSLAALFFVCTSIIDHLEPSNLGLVPRSLLGFPLDGIRFKSGFPIVPWLGYGFAGAALGSMLAKRKELLTSGKLGILILFIASLLLLLPYGVLAIVDFISGDLIVPLIDSGYDFIRLGRVLLFIGLIAFFLDYRHWIIANLSRFRSLFNSIAFTSVIASLGCIVIVLSYWILLPTFLLQGAHIFLFVGLVLISIKIIPWNYELFLKIGRHTLSIYVLHAIVLYGGFVGIGVDTLFAKSLSPWLAIISCALFIYLFILLVKHIERLPWLLRLMK